LVIFLWFLVSLLFGRDGVDTDVLVTVLVEEDETVLSPSFFISFLIGFVNVDVVTLAVLDEEVDGIDVVELFVDTGRVGFERFSATDFVALGIKLEEESVANKNGSNFGFGIKGGIIGGTFKFGFAFIAVESGKGGINWGIVVSGAIGFGTIFAVEVLVEVDGADAVNDVCFVGKIGVDIKGINGLTEDEVAFGADFGVDDNAGAVTGVVLVEEVCNGNDFDDAFSFGAWTEGVEEIDTDVKVDDFDLEVVESVW